MKILEIEEGDEVILQGHTCSVMVNAVLRVGATPIFADIDRNTFGSSKIEIEKNISKYEMIVAQHSFGIPCDIVLIQELARSKGIFLLEDCAISFGSKINGVQIGNFGDASLFSIDHSKPLNACIGGLIYTNNISLFEKLKVIQEASDDLPQQRQNALWKKFLFEHKYYNPSSYGKSFILSKICRTLMLEKDSYLADDYTKNASKLYPYLAKLTKLSAFLGQ